HDIEAKPRPDRVRVEVVVAHKVVAIEATNVGFHLGNEMENITHARRQCRHEGLTYHPKSRVEMWPKPLEYKVPHAEPQNHPVISGVARHSQTEPDSNRPFVKG